MPQLATCHSCRNVISVICGSCETARSPYAWGDKRQQGSFLDAELCEGKEESMDDSGALTVRIESMQEVVFPVPNSKHFVAFTMQGHPVGAAETQEELTISINDFLRRHTTEIVMVYESVSSVGIKLDTETRNF
jgi:hypothetical protein